VRPRGDRLEVTVDFTPAPGLMIATAALIIGIVREVMSWPSYRLSLLDELKVPTVAGVVPGKHTTRKGWLTKDFHYPQSPYTSDVDERLWSLRQGGTASLRAIARQVAWHFRLSIRRYCDPFSFRLLFAVLDGRAPSMLELPDRSRAYEDVGRLCHWGMVLPELREMRHQQVARVSATAVSQPQLVGRAAGETRPLEIVAQAKPPEPRIRADADPEVRGPELAPALAEPAMRTSARTVRIPAGANRLVPRQSPKKPDPPIERRRSPRPPPRGSNERRAQRRRREQVIPFPDRRLTRSTYEQVFLKLVSGGHLKIGRSTYTPVGMRGWYHAIFRRDSDGKERLMSIDQLVKKMRDWTV
jgi:hypothetical protein